MSNAPVGSEVKTLKGSETKCWRLFSRQTTEVSLSSWTLGCLGELETRPGTVSTDRNGFLLGLSFSGPLCHPPRPILGLWFFLGPQNHQDANTEGTPRCRDCNTTPRPENLRRPPAVRMNLENPGPGTANWMVRRGHTIPERRLPQRSLSLEISPPVIPSAPGWVLASPRRRARKWAMQAAMDADSPVPGASVGFGAMSPKFSLSRPARGLNLG